MAQVYRKYSLRSYTYKEIVKWTVWKQARTFLRSHIMHHVDPSLGFAGLMGNISLDQAYTMYREIEK